MTKANSAKKPSEYEVKAGAFLAKCGIKFQAVFLYHGPHWEGENRNVWSLILQRGKQPPLVTKFGQSINDSFSKVPRYYRGHPKQVFDLKQTAHKTPSAYDLLYCLTKNDPGSFKDFCGDFGYDEDSRKAEKTYIAVMEEWHNVSRFFSAEEIQDLQEIN